MNPSQHWNQVFTEKAHDSVSWFQPEPQPSLDLIRTCIEKLNLPTVKVLEMGGGDSHLPDFLLQNERIECTVLDLSARALQNLQNRLGISPPRLQTRVANSADWSPDTSWHIGHDRASFHFLTEAEDIKAYVQRVGQAIVEGGFLIVGTFSADGPEKCSGLPVSRYSAEALAETFAPDFQLVDSLQHKHTTPADKVQNFTFVVLQRVSAK